VLKIAINFLISIRSKLLFAFLAMSLLVGAIGGYAYYGINYAGKVIADTYDRPLMAINFSRSASQTFARINVETLKFRQMRQDGESPSWDKIDGLIEDFRSDMVVVEERSISDKARIFIEQTSTASEVWFKDIKAPDYFTNPEKLMAFEKTVDQIFSNLDIIVELQANESFLSREEAEGWVDKIRFYSILAVVGALCLAMLLSIWMSLTILRPLKTAVSVAHKISGGQFDVAIPQGRQDETGLLLKSMTVMQQNIRNRINRETTAKSLAQGQLSAALANSQDAVLIANAQNEITVVNEQVKIMFPMLDSDKMLGDSLVKYFNYDGHPVSGLDSMADNGEIRFKDGRWARINASNMQEGGRLLIWTDITEAKQREKTLEVAKDAAEAAYHAKTMFLASMSHELRTPLNAIIAFSDLMTQEHFGEMGHPKYQEMSGVIYSSGEQLFKVIEDVLEFSGEDKNIQDNMAYKPVSLNGLIKGALDKIELAALQRGIEIIHDPGEADAFIAGHSGKLKSVFSNIIENAEKFNKDNGVIKISTVRLANDRVQIDIIDTGIGIGPNDIDRVMSPFVQVDDSYKRGYGGSGLGLSIAHRWVKFFGGSIKIFSKLHKGTCVRVILPAQSAKDLIKPFPISPDLETAA